MRKAHIIGVVVREISSETVIAVDRVMANSRNRRPMMPPISRIGRKTAISDTLIDSTVKPTSWAPFRAASMRPMPSSTWRVTFSSTTMASSTTKPVAMVRAISDRLSREKPSRNITPTAPSRETLTATLGISTARPLCRKKATTPTTSTREISTVRSTSARDARMVVVRSTATCMSMSAGSTPIRAGILALTRSTVSMMLALGWRLMTTTTAGWPLMRPRLWMSSTESWTWAMSVRRTGAPFRQATIRGA